MANISMIGDRTVTSYIPPSYASDPKFKKYTQQVDKCLNSFDNVQEWADFISFLKQLLKVHTVPWFTSLCYRPLDSICSLDLNIDISSVHAIQGNTQETYSCKTVVSMSESCVTHWCTSTGVGCVCTRIGCRRGASCFCSI